MKRNFTNLFSNFVKFSRNKHTIIYNNKTKDEWLDYFNNRAKFGSVGNNKFKLVDIGVGMSMGQITLEEIHLAPNGFVTIVLTTFFRYVHGGIMAFLADTTCGYGTIAHLVDENRNFATSNFSINLIGTEKEGETITCISKLEHLGKRTQIWSAKIYNKSEKLLALFTCTQILLDDDSNVHKDYKL